MKTEKCQFCATLTKACRLKDKEIQRLHNKVKHLIEAKAKMARRLDGCSVPRRLQ